MPGSAGLSAAGAGVPVLPLRGACKLSALGTAFASALALLACAAAGAEPGRAALVGLATDFCVAYSALDAAKLGFDVTLWADACRAIDLNGSLAEAKVRALAAGATWVD